VRPDHACTFGWNYHRSQWHFLQVCRLDACVFWIADGVGPMEPATTQSTMGPHVEPLRLRLYNSSEPWAVADPYISCKHAFLRPTGNLVGSSQQHHSYTQSGAPLHLSKSMWSLCTQCRRQQRLRPTALPNQQ
jgi:hypothetical protein